MTSVKDVMYAALTPSSNGSLKMKSFSFTINLRLVNTKDKIIKKLKLVSK